MANKYTNMCRPKLVSARRMTPTSSLLAKSSKDSTVGFIFGTVRDEMTIPENELTKTMPTKAQNPTKIRNELLLDLSLHPSIVSNMFIREVKNK